MYDAIVVGGAAAGLTAALYTSRQGLKTLVLAKDIGGQASLTPHIENFPGFKSITGFELMQLIQEQAKSFGAEFRYQEVIEVKQIENWFRVKSQLGEYDSKAIILAFGKTPRSLGIPGEERLTGKGVSYCYVCDAPMFKDKDVSVIGWGDPALDAAEMLCGIANRTHLIHKGTDFLGNENLLQACKKKGNLNILPQTNIIEIKGEKKVESIIIQNEINHEIKELYVNGVFIEMGYISKTDFLKNLVALNSQNEIIVDKTCTTNHPGIFAAGDVTDLPYKQAVISAGDGAKAALSAYNYVQKLYGKPTIRADWKSLIKTTL